MYFCLVRFESIWVFVGFFADGALVRFLIAVYSLVVIKMTLSVRTVWTATYSAFESVSVSALCLQLLFLAALFCVCVTAESSCTVRSQTTLLPFRVRFGIHLQI